MFHKVPIERVFCEVPWDFPCIEVAFQKSYTDKCFAQAVGFFKAFQRELCEAPWGLVHKYMCTYVHFILFFPIDTAMLIKSAI